MFNVANIAAILQPLQLVRVTIAPLGAVVAVPENTTLALPRARQCARPVVHALVVARVPRGIRTEGQFIGRGRVEQAGGEAGVVQALPAGLRAIQQGLDLRQIRIVDNVLVEAQRLHEAIDSG